MYASHFHEEGNEASFPSLDVHAEVPSSGNTPQTDHAEASTQTDNSTDFKRSLELLMEIKCQIYALGCEFQSMQNAHQATSVSLHDQVQATANGEDLAQLKEDLKTLEETVKSMGDFQLIRIPKQS